MANAPANRGRLLIAKVGLDGHDRGARVIGSMLREEGFEVVYVGIRHTPEQVAEVAAREEVDVVGLSILSGAHVELSAAVRRELDEIGCGHVPVVVGGLIPHRDGEAMKSAGIAKVFHPGEVGVGSERVTDTIDEMVGQARQAAAGASAAGSSRT